MKKMVAAASPDAYVSALGGWRRSCVELLRDAARSVTGVDEVIKWGNMVYLTNGPVFMIRAEDERLLFGFWRGARLRALEPRLKPGGKYEMATLEIREATVADARAMKRLVRAAVTLNREVGDPTADAAPHKAPTTSARRPATKARAV
jgi:hypothetical protein